MTISCCDLLPDIALEDEQRVVVKEAIAASPDASSLRVTREPFEEFAPLVNVHELPIVLFTDNGHEQLVWHYGSIAGGHVEHPDDPPDVRAIDPVVMSPAYLGFAIEPFQQRYLQYSDVGIVFARPMGAEFMQPSIDTILVCCALEKLFAEGGRAFKSIVDVGSGSGFIGKFAAMKAPGVDQINTTLIDIDPAATEYCRSPGFGAKDVSHMGRGVTWEFIAGDAASFLSKGTDCDLIVANPPYIPTRDETLEEDSLTRVKSFWEGCSLLVHIIECLGRGLFLPGAHLVLALTSLTLKSCRVRALLDEAPRRGLQVRILLEREIAWKAWYAGRGGSPHYLMASEEEADTRCPIGENDFFVGATVPGESRMGGNRNSLWGYHWHYAYVLDITRTQG